MIKTNNSTNLSSVTSTLISLYLKKIIKDGHLNKPAKSKEEIPRELLHQKTKIREGRDKHSWDIDCRRKAVLPRTLEIP